jgi:aminoglycoside 2''-phosphotransferase
MDSSEASSKLAGYIETLRAACPGLSIETSEGIFTGQFNIIIFVNKTWIFRFPRFAEEIQRAIGEAKLLSSLRGRLPLPIPDPQFIHLEPPIPGRVFFGYQRLPGDPLYRPLLAQTRSEETLNRLAGQLASFLRALHTIPSTDINISAHVADHRAEYEQMFREVRENLFQAMRPDARKEVSTHYEAYLDDPGLHDFPPVPRHGDFGGSNILYDPARQAISGIVDFSACAMGDAAADLASISTLGESFYIRILDHYAPDPSTRSRLTARARFYRGTFALSEALAGLRTGDAKAYASGMVGYV